MKIFFWGAGRYANNIWNKIEENPEVYLDDYIGFIDNNPNLWGNYLFGKKIISPYEIKNYKIDRIVITSIFAEEIKKQMINEIRIPEEVIFSFEEYDQSCFANKKFAERYRYSTAINDSYNCFNDKKTVVYTAIMGDYDDLKLPLNVNHNLTYVCFTNNYKLKSDIWHIEYIKEKSLDNVHFARKIKTKPYLFLKDFEVSVWIDGKFSIHNDLKKYIEKYGRNKPMLCFPHHVRECIYDEAVACMWVHKDSKEKIIHQISDYYKEKYPFNNGLYETGCIVRLHHDEYIKKIMDQWYEQIEVYSYRDQISLPVVCWKNNFIPDICNLNINKNDWLKWHTHHF